METDPRWYWPSINFGHTIHPSSDMVLIECCTYQIMHAMEMYKRGGKMSSGVRKRKCKRPTSKFLWDDRTVLEWILLIGGYLLCNDYFTGFLSFRGYFLSKFIPLFLLLSDIYKVVCAVIHVCGLSSWSPSQASPKSSWLSSTNVWDVGPTSWTTKSSLTRCSLLLGLRLHGYTSYMIDLLNPLVDIQMRQSRPSIVPDPVNHPPDTRQRNNAYKNDTVVIHSRAGSRDRICFTSPISVISKESMVKRKYLRKQ